MTVQQHCATDIRPRFSVAARRRDRQGIVLLVVLGMLTLFSVLGVSYLVFTSRQRSSAVSISRSESRQFDSSQLTEAALTSALVGSTGPESSLWGHDLLGDLYGMRDAIEGAMTPRANFVVDTDVAAPDVLLDGFVRIPTELYHSSTDPLYRTSYPNRRTDSGAPERFYPLDATPTFTTDEELAGRILTFASGPLEEISMRIIRSFGDHTGAPIYGTAPNRYSRSVLTGQLILDMRPHFDKSVTVDSLSETRTLGEWIEAAKLPVTDPDYVDISLLFYDQIPTSGSGALPLATFYVNGRVLNGPGLGWDRERAADLTGTGSDAMNLIEKISVDLNPAAGAPTANQITGGSSFENSDRGKDVPVALEGHYAIYRRETELPFANSAEAFLQDLPGGDVDEPYDAPDEQNWWLSYFPTVPGLGTPTPSFVRPGILHWLINQQDPSVSLQSIGSNDMERLARLREILRAIQRATLRPLPIENDPTVPASIAARPNGVLQLDYSRFTGGNSTALGTAVNYSETNPIVLAAQIRALVQSLAGIDSDGDGLRDWDVDNDNDGDPDSVWVDAGLPIVEDENGNLVKPLVAYMTEDLSGRIDVNLAGNLVQARRRDLNSREMPIRPSTVPLVVPTMNAASGVLFRTGAPTSTLAGFSTLPVGFGYGPAEIDLRPLFSPSFNTGGVFGSASTTINGPLRLLRQRLVSRNIGGVEVVSAGHLLDPATADIAWNLTTASGNDLPGVLRQPNFPNVHSTANGYGLPLDKFGRGSVSLGVNGGLMLSGISTTVQHAGIAAGDVTDDPYEMSLDPGGNPDNGFTLTDLEGVLRINDFDRDALDSELVNLAESYFNNTAATMAAVNDTRDDRQLFANSITTISSSTEDSRGIMPQEFRSSAATQRENVTGAVNTQHILVHDDMAATSEEDHNAILMQLLPREVLAGQKMNLNRPFGNGLDDDSDGIIDEPQEIRGAVQVLYNDFTGTPSTTPFSTSFTDLTPGEPGPTNEIDIDRRLEPSPQALFARHLYVMAMDLCRDPVSNHEFDFSAGAGLVVDPSNRTFVDPSDTTTANTAEDEYRAHVLAQWAINVADFRDPDSIMSRFDYDVAPFESGAASGAWDIVDVGGNRTFRTVWGMEYPELALEESLAFHDRRVRDTDVDNNADNVNEGVGGGPSAGPTRRFQSGDFRDKDTDQWRIPQGSLFLELRSTRSPDYLRVPTNDGDPVAQAWAVPAELYAQIDTDPSANARYEYMLDLARTAPDRNPVWRVAITRAHNRELVPPNPTWADLEPFQISADEMLRPIGSTTSLWLDEDGAVAADVDAEVRKRRLTATLDPTQPQIFGPAVPDAVERVVWFTNDNPDNGVGSDSTADDGTIDFAPADSQNIERVFFNRFADAGYTYQTQAPNSLLLRGGQYAVIGPRADTRLGALEFNSVVGGPTHDATTSEPLVDYGAGEYESPQRFLLSPGGFDYRVFTDLSAMPTLATGNPDESIRSAVGIVAAANPPGGALWNASASQQIGLNVSEPLPYFTTARGTYYPSPTKQLHSDATINMPFDSYYDYADGTGSLPDEPFDNQAWSELASVFGAPGQQTGTRERFKTAYLQRLADPTQNYDANFNPYISVDYITIDLTVFNGSDNNREETDSMGVPGWIDNNDPEPFSSAPDESFATRYKTGKTLFTDKAAAVNENLSHSVNTFPPQNSSTAIALSGHTAYFDHDLQIQPNLHPDSTAALPVAPNERARHPDINPDRSIHSSTLGYANASYGDRWYTLSNDDAALAGTPHSNYFTTVGWANRPFASPLELTWVPTTSAGRFAASFGTATADTGFTTGGDVFEGAGNPVGNRTEINRVFPHLWNYFAGDPTDFTNSPNFYRILDWVTVPAPFDFEADFLSTNSDLQTYQNANSTAASAWGGLFTYSAFSPTASTVTSNPDTWNNPAAIDHNFWLNRFTIEPFRAPMNILQPPYRHGRINLNTIKSPLVYRALMQGIQQPGDDLQGAFYGAAGLGFIQSRRGYSPGSAPTTAEPFSVDGIPFHRNHATQASGAFRPANSSDLSPLESERAQISHPLQQTMLRPGGTMDSFTSDPLFSRPAGSGTITEEFRQRSIVHQNMELSRLPNLATDQSNTYAVWITVGLFTVDGADMSVGDEVGNDTGEAKRFRSLHIIDRGIPVQYEPGVLNNAKDTVLLSRELN